jgi:tRNA (cmo5U34)-methyltransferase
MTNEILNSFSFNTIKDFDDHIDKSIPNYDILVDAIKSMSEYFFIDGANVYDLGCSTGKLLKSLNNNCNKIGYDVATLLPNEEGFTSVDLNEPFELNNACVVYSIFTMQFLNPNSREMYLKTIYDGLQKGGALIICEKVYQEFGKLQEVFSFSHYDYKLNHFTTDEIIKKERDLRFIMKPMSNNDLFQLINSIGFNVVAPFWQMYNFKGIIAIK